MRHIINAYHNNKLVTTFFRDSTDTNVEIIYRFLKVEEFFECDPNVINKKVFKEIEIDDVLDLFEHYQHMKEIDFLKPCLYKLRNNENKTIELMFSKEI